tara:strand:- start:132 stop:308 length:177 start_codon:yes stop_codon:yes gene_type:complete
LQVRLKLFKHQPAKSYFILLNPLKNLLSFFLAAPQIDLNNSYTSVAAEMGTVDFIFSK